VVLATACALTLGACGHEELPPEGRPVGRTATAASLQRIELDARLLRRRAEESPIKGRAARLEAIDALLAHIALTTRFLAENRLRAAEVGTELAEITYDLMRADFEASVRGISGAVRRPCNRGLEWTGGGIQGLARDPGWVDRTEEVAQFGVLQVASEGGAAIQLVTGAGALTLTHAEVMVLANAGQLSATAAALHMMASGQPPKVPQVKAFEEWARKLPVRPTPTTSPAGKYEVAQTGPSNYKVQGAGEEPIWADGLRSSDGHALEAKHVGDAASSPYVDGSSCPDFVRANALADLVNEFRRYAAVIRDVSNPVVGLEVVVSDAKAVPLFERLMAEFSIPGQVVVRPP